MASSNITIEPREAEGFVAYEIPSGNLYFFVSSKYEFKFGYIYKKVGHLKGQFINLKLKAQFIRQETPWGSSGHVNYYQLILIFIRSIQNRLRIWINKSKIEDFKTKFIMGI